LSNTIAFLDWYGEKGKEKVVMRKGKCFSYRLTKCMSETMHAQNSSIRKSQAPQARNINKTSVNRKHLTFKVGIAKVEHNNTKMTTVILVNNTSTHIQKVLDGQTRSRSHTTVGSLGKSDRNISGNNGTVASGDDGVGGAVEFGVKSSVDER
jgi:hypothetical protein